MATNLYTGFHAVEEKIRHFMGEKNSSIKLTVFYSKPGPRIKKIISQAQSAGITCTQVSDRELDAMVQPLSEISRDHRGIVLSAEGEKERASNLVQLDQWIKSCPQKATVVILDSVTDPHNIGAVLRSLDQFGADLLIVPEYHSTQNIHENQIIARSSAGASAWVNLAVETNLVRSVKILKDSGFWIYGADAGGIPLQTSEFAEKTCIIMGSEGSGISRLLTEQCDKVISIPTCGKIDSLNVSVATGIILYERYKQSLR